MLYRLETPKGKVLCHNISINELRDITRYTTEVIDVFDQDTNEFMGEYNPNEEDVERR